MEDGLGRRALLARVLGFVGAAVAVPFSIKEAQSGQCRHRCIPVTGYERLPAARGTLVRHGGDPDRYSIQWDEDLSRGAT